MKKKNINKFSHSAGRASHDNALGERHQWNTGIPRIVEIILEIRLHGVYVSRRFAWVEADRLRCMYQVRGKFCAKGVQNLLNRLLLGHDVHGRDTLRTYST